MSHKSLSSWHLMPYVLYIFVSLLTTSLYGQNPLCLFGVEENYDVHSSPRAANAASSIPYLDNIPWVDTNNLDLGNQLYARTTVNSGENSELLYVNGFNFDIPDFVDIQGVELRLKGQRLSGDTIKDLSIYLTNGVGQPVGLNKANRAIVGSEWNQDSLQSIGYWIYGSNSDDWNSNLSPSDINSSQFGVMIQVHNNGTSPAEVLLDQVYLRVYYTPVVDICNDHSCLSVMAYDPNMASYQWQMNGNIRTEVSNELPHVLNIYGEPSQYGTYELCLTTTDNFGQSEQCCRSLVYRPCNHGSIGDFVWEDSNGNGFQDFNESGMDDIRVHLFDESQNFIEETLTQNGMYQFNNVKPGNYFIRVISSEYCPTVLNPNNETLNSDFYEYIGPSMSRLITLESGQNISNIDFGLVKKSSLGGLTWIDRDANGLFEAVDTTLAFVNVSLINAFGQVSKTTQSDASGQYLFEDVIPGDYSIQFDFPEPFLASNPGPDNLVDSSFKTQTLSINVNTNQDNISAGAFRPSQIGDFVWFDANRDQIQNFEEAGLPEVRVSLLDCDNNLIQEEQSDSSGLYIISDITPGEYQICFESLNGDLIPSSQQSFEFTGSTTQICTECLFIYENENHLDLDVVFELGFIRIDVNVWYDNDLSGENDLNESYTEGALVELYNCDDELVNEGITDGLGMVDFVDILAGSYYIAVSHPDADAFSLETDISNDNGFGTTNCYDLFPPGVSFNVGIVETSDLGDLIWQDLNRNGLQDPDEPGIEGLPVSLYQCDTILMGEAFTDSDGRYLFENLLPGSYNVCVEYDNEDFERTISLTDSSEFNSDFVDPENSSCSACINIGPDQQILDLDFGFAPKRIDLGVHVFNDFDFTGIFDNNDINLNDIEVTLFDCDNNLIGTQSSDLDGKVNFIDLQPGDYYFHVDIEPGTGINPNSEFDNSNGPNTSSCITVPGDTKELVVPVIELTEVGDYVWIDVNQDGLQDANEPGLSGVELTLMDCNMNAIAETISDANGQYLFTDVAPGEYTICADAPGTNFSKTVSNNSNDELNSDFTDSEFNSCSSCFTVEPFTDKRDIDFGYIADFTSIAVILWNDFSSDGTFDQGEEVREGVEVSLVNCNGVVVNTLVSDFGGQLIFEDVPFGEYYIEVSSAGGIGFSTSNITEAFGVGTTDCNLTDPTINIYEIGILEPSSIGDFVWFDENGNGLQDTDEPGVEGITLTLLDESGQVAQEATTDAQGFYQFEGLLPGDYRIIIFSIDATYRVTRDNEGNNDAIDSDFIVTNTIVSVPVFTLEPFVFKDDLDLGLELDQPQILGRVWMDSDGDKLFGNEDGLSNAEVMLRSCDSTLISQTFSDNEGYFAFRNLVDDEYYVEVLEMDAMIIADGGDSDVTNANGLNTTDCFEITEDSFVEINVGAIPMGSAELSVWLDSDEDGVQNEFVAPDFEIEIALIDTNDEVIEQLFTDADGLVYFDNIYPGQYRFEIKNFPEGFQPTVLNAGNNEEDNDFSYINGRLLSPIIRFSDTQTILDIDFGIVAEQMLVSGYIWRDSDFDLTENGESLMPQVLVTLFDCDNNQVDETRTDSNGLYEFYIAEPGDYYIAVEAIDDFSFGLGQASGLDNTNGEGTSACITVVPGEVIEINAAVVPLAQIGDFVWLDENVDGRQDSNEPGVEGIIVHLIDSNGNIVNEAETNSDGHYSFTEVLPGEYYLSLDNYQGVYNATLQALGSDDGDSDLRVVSGSLQSENFIVFDGVENLDIDLGLTRIQTIVGGKVFLDASKDGILNGVEEGLVDINVELYDAQNNLLQSSVTDSGGVYRFYNLFTGEYRLRFEALDDYIFSPALLGTDPIFDSDVISDDGFTDLFVVSGGGVMEGVNAGYILSSACISGIMFEDLDQNGIYDLNPGGLKDDESPIQKSNGESGITGAEVSLLDANLGIINTITTDNSGAYVFCDIAPGQYYIAFEAPEGYEFTEANAIQDELLDSDVVDFNLGLTEIIVLEDGSLVQGVNAGVYTSFSAIEGRVWLDVNEDGLIDAIEPGIEAVIVQLYDANDALIATTETNDIGDYRFYDNYSGTFYIVFEKPSSYEFTSSLVGVDPYLHSHVDNLTTGATNMFVVNANNTIDYINAGFTNTTRETFSLSGIIWEDYDANGLLDSNEPGINDVLVQLYDANGGFVAESSSELHAGVNGYYSFEDIPEGQYYVQFNVEQNFNIIEANVGSDITINSKVDNSFGLGTTSLIELTENTRNINLGIYVPSTIGDYVWFDQNVNGIQDANEQGVPDVNVQLFDADGILLKEAFTDQNGNYSFGDIGAGDYEVVFSSFANFQFTIQNADSDEQADSNVDLTGSTGIITLEPRQRIRDIDAGLILPGSSISGFAWFDKDDNGVYDSSEDRLESVVVFLLDGDGTSLLAETETNEFGEYIFDNLSVGEYLIQFQALNERAFTTPDVGVAETNSDVNQNGFTDIIEVRAGQDISNISAGYVLVNKSNFSSVYPNPVLASSILEVDIDNYLNAKTFDYRLFDSSGNVVQKSNQTEILNHGNNKLSINTENLNSGIYSLEVKMGRYRQFHKLIIME